MRPGLEALEAPADLLVCATVDRVIVPRAIVDQNSGGYVENATEAGRFVNGISLLFFFSMISTFLAQMPSRSLSFFRYLFP